jgi:hypothetical protein
MTKVRSQQGLRKVLSVGATTRNWNTVNKVPEAAEDLPSFSAQNSFQTGPMRLPKQLAGPQAATLVCTANLAEGFQSAFVSGAKAII